MARANEAVLEQLWLRIDGDDVADIDAELGGFVLGRGPRVDPHLDIGPAGRLLVDFLVEGMARGLQGQNRAGVGAKLGKDGAARACGEARIPMTDGNELEPPGVLHALHLGAERVEMSGNGAGGTPRLAAEPRPDGAAARDLERHAEAVELGAAMPDDVVGEAGRARNFEQLGQAIGQIVEVDMQDRHGEPFSRQRRLAQRRTRQALSVSRTAAGIDCGNRRSTNRSAVGCGSWLASPGRSLASMNQ